MEYWKLIKLLNKYKKEKIGKNIVKYINYNEDWRGQFLYEVDWAYYDIDECVILSKKYGFIKRLVENNKIDFDKLKPLSWVTEIMLATTHPNWIKTKRRYRLYEQLIMLLSISDSPVDDLISYLR